MSLSSIMVPAILHEEMPVGVAPWAGKGPTSIPGAVSSVPPCLVPLSLGQRLGKVLGWREHKMISFHFMGKGRGKASALLPMPYLQTQLQAWWLSPAGGHSGVPRSGCLCCGLATAWCAFVLSASLAGLRALVPVPRGQKALGLLHTALWVLCHTAGSEERQWRQCVSDLPLSHETSSLLPSSPRTLSPTLSLFWSCG